MSRRETSTTKKVAAPLLMLCMATALLLVIAPRPAHGAMYKMVLCAGNNGSNSFGTDTNTRSGANPSGIFSFENYCGPAPDPAGSNAFLRIAENQPSGFAGQGAWGKMWYSTPPFVHFKSAGGYTRQPNAFNDGWRSRFWIIDFAGQGHQLITQGAGLPNCCGQWASSNIFGPHLWPFGYFMDFHTFVFEMNCVRPAGCDRANFNATDANSFVFLLNDDQDAQIGFTNTGSTLMQGGWVKGGQNVTWNVSDNGSGLRWERLRVDGTLFHQLDHGGGCDLGFSGQNGEFARRFQPCPTGGPYGHAYGLSTASLPDGAHTLQVCAQDYGQAVGIAGTGSESCTQATIRVDNTAPAAPKDLAVTSANPARYLDQFGAQWTLPANSGSPITKIHYNVVNANGDVVVPVKTASGTNPSSLANINGPSQAGEYRLRVWLEDAVGFQGPASTAPIPRDTTPPAAPQEVSVTPPSTSRAADGFDLRWKNLVDSGAPISSVSYQVVADGGRVVVPTQAVAGDNIDKIVNLESPEDRGGYELRLWLADAEGNVGAPASVPLAYTCVRSDVNGGKALVTGLGPNRKDSQIVHEGSGSVLTGELRGPGGDGVASAPLCVFSRVITDKGKEFAGIAVTGSNGNYEFPVKAGASRDLSVVYRSDHREVTTHATIETVVHPTFKVKKKRVYNRSFAHFSGRIPGPNNNRVVIVLQAKRGKGWIAFRRYRTRRDGQFKVPYRFTRTTRPTVYIMRAQVRQQVGYPYRQGNSRKLTVIVVPKKPSSQARR